MRSRVCITFDSLDFGPAHKHAYAFLLSLCTRWIIHARMFQQLDVRIKKEARGISIPEKSYGSVCLTESGISSNIFQEDKKKLFWAGRIFPAHPDRNRSFQLGINRLSAYHKTAPISGQNPTSSVYIMHVEHKFNDWEECWNLYYKIHVSNNRFVLLSTKLLTTILSLYIILLLIRSTAFKRLIWAFTGPTLSQQLVSLSLRIKFLVLCPISLDWRKLISIALHETIAGGESAVKTNFYAYTWH